MTLRSKQLIVLDFIKEFIAKYGYSPTIREIQEGLCLKSPSTVHEHLQKLVLAGLITVGKNKSRTIELLVENEYLNDSEEIISIPLLNTFKDDVAADYVKIPMFMCKNNDTRHLLVYSLDNIMYLINTDLTDVDKPSLTVLEKEYFIEEKPKYKIIGNIIGELKVYKTEKH